MSESDDRRRPLVLERFRRAGFLMAILLAPLLVVTLAQTPVSRVVALVLLVAGGVVVGLLGRRER
jgi:hypothetical protein